MALTVRTVFFLDDQCDSSSCDRVFMNLADVLRFVWMTIVTVAVGADFSWMRIVTLHIAFGTCLSFLLVWSFIEFYFRAWQAYT